MLIYIGPRRQTYILRTLKRDERMPAIAGRTYAWLFRTPRLPAATYVFVGIDRLDAGERRLAAAFYRHINAAGPGYRALNNPALAMGRHRLLRALFEAGINDFNAYLATESTKPKRYPVFVRRHSASTVPLTGLIENEAKLNREVDRLIAAGEVAEDLLIIEYCAEEFSPGVYVKQAEYRVADRYTPNASIYGSGWHVKYSNRIEVGDDIYRHDTEILTENRFADVSRRAFEIANIEYGRADIGIVGGRPQFYEINFNPDLRTQRERPHANKIHAANWTISDDQVWAAIRAIDSPAGGSIPTISNLELRQFRLRFWRNYAPQRY